MRVSLCSHNRYGPKGFGALTIRNIPNVRRLVFVCMGGSGCLCCVVFMPNCVVRRPTPNPWRAQYAEARQKLIPMAHKLAHLPADELAKLEHAGSMYKCVGWGLLFVLRWRVQPPAALTHKHPSTHTNAHARHACTLQ